MQELLTKGRLYSYLSSELSKVSFVISQNRLAFRLMSQEGILETYLEVDNDDPKVYTFNVDFSRWNTVALKFMNYSSVVLNLQPSVFTIASGVNADRASIGITSYEEHDTLEEEYVYLNAKERDIKENGRELILTQELAEDFELMFSMFSTQSNSNAIGINEKSVIYADSSVVLKANLAEPIPATFFDNFVIPEEFEDSDQNEECVYIHSKLLRLMPLLRKTNLSLWFSKDYHFIFWEDDNTKLVVPFSDAAAHLPTDEQFEGLHPHGTVDTITVDTNLFKEAVCFFDGIYDSVEEWRPLRFTTEDGVSLVYKSLSTYMTRMLSEKDDHLQASFLLSSDTIRSILTKVCNMEGEKPESSITYNDIDNQICLQIGDRYEAIILKLDDI